MVWLCYTTNTSTLCQYRLTWPGLWTLTEDPGARWALQFRPGHAEAAELQVMGSSTCQPDSTVTTMTSIVYHDASGSRPQIVLTPV